MNTDHLGANTKSKPTLVFFETTVACDYRCRHCRASTQADPAPDELTAEEVKRALESVTRFGRPYPTVIFTGGNLLMKENIREIISYTHELGIPFSLSPSGSSLITPDFINFSVENGVSSMSVSIDGGEPKIHDWIRRNPGSFNLTLALISELHAAGIPVQINTTVMKKNMKNLPYIAKLLKDLGIKIWEVFFLIKTGRGLYERELSPEEIEDVNLWLSTLEDYGINVRPVESPMLKRIRKQKAEGVKTEGGELFMKLEKESLELLGAPHLKPKEPLKRGPRPEFGLMFVSHNGNVYPNGFLPFSRGNVRDRDLTDIYWNDEIFSQLNSRENLKGKCGYCDFKAICGGSRSRAYAAYEDPFAEDPGCTYMPPKPNLVGGR